MLPNDHAKPIMNIDYKYRLAEENNTWNSLTWLTLLILSYTSL